MRITSNILFVLSITALVAALVVAVICMVAGRPDDAFPAVSALALAGVAVGAMAIIISGLGHRRQHMRARSIQPHGNG